MKTFKTLLTTFSAFSWVAQAGVIHLDLTDSGDVTVEIDSEPQALQSDNHCVEDDGISHSRVETQSTIFGQYDVTLPYEVHRGFLSVNHSQY